MTDLVAAAESVRNLLEPYEDRVEWGEFPWLVDRLLDALGGGVGLHPTDAIEIKSGEAIAVGRLLVALEDEAAVLRATEIVYGEVDDDFREDGNA